MFSEGVLRGGNGRHGNLQDITAGTNTHVKSAVNLADRGCLYNHVMFRCVRIKTSSLQRLVTPYHTTPEDLY